jgi:hypothetical protein
MRKRATITLLLGVVTLLALAGSVAGRSGPLPPDLQAVRAALANYNSFDQAQAAGYSAAGQPCIASPDGTMGIHAVNAGILASGQNDPDRPPILVYLPQDDGSLKLVAAEWMAVALANTASGPAPWFGQTPPPDGFFNAAPSILGQTFDGPMPGHNPQMPWHYDLHAWIFEANPSGVFAPFNPAISCPAG